MQVMEQIQLVVIFRYGTMILIPDCTLEWEVCFKICLHWGLDINFLLSFPGDCNM